MIFKKFIYKKINSTNDMAIKKIKKKFIKGIIIAEEQKKGKVNTEENGFLKKVTFSFRFFSE